MLDFIVKYWLEVAFGLVCATIAWLARHYIQLQKETDKNHQDQLLDSIQNKINEQYEKTQQQIDNQYNKIQQQMDLQYKNLINLVELQNKEIQHVDTKITTDLVNMKKDVLSIEGSFFKQECRRLLHKDHIITEEEFNTITVQHIAYNGLGGNHEGDAMYDSVNLKYHNQKSN